MTSPSHPLLSLNFFFTGQQYAIPPIQFEGKEEGLPGPSAGWWQGPIDPEGFLFDASDRNVSKIQHLFCLLFFFSVTTILCMSLFGDRCVIGSADHALKEFDVSTGKETRTLYHYNIYALLRLTNHIYTKRYGHTEWVTTVTHLDDGRVLSGAMDSKV